MKLRNGNTPGGNLPLAVGTVTSENFEEKAIGFMRASGRQNGDHPVIKRPSTGEAGTPQAWDAWLTYLERLRGPKRLRFARSHGVLTVPSLYPWDFSQDADDLRPDGDPTRPTVARPYYADL